VAASLGIARAEPETKGDLDKSGRRISIWKSGNQEIKRIRKKGIRNSGMPTSSPSFLLS
jgi:hypothetical protein